MKHYKYVAIALLISSQLLSLLSKADDATHIDKSRVIQLIITDENGKTTKATRPLAKVDIADKDSVIIESERVLHSDMRLRFIACKITKDLILKMGYESISHFYVEARKAVKDGFQSQITCTLEIKQNEQTKIYKHASFYRIPSIEEADVDSKLLEKFKTQKDEITVNDYDKLDTELQKFKQLPKTSYQNIVNGYIADKVEIEIESTGKPLIVL